MISIVELDTPYREPWARSCRSLFTGLLTYEISRSVGAISEPKRGESLSGNGSLL